RRKGDRRRFSDRHRNFHRTAIGIGDRKDIIARTQVALCRGDRIWCRTARRGDHHRAIRSAITAYIGDGRRKGDRRRFSDR
ncbi:hypothetical protein MD537_27475, partial [Flavihumibacter sediminis]|nr:hypothetical protein [Flavihumibacter sediminis]